ncbi:dehydrogenase, putative [Babesia ovis]|uniref:Dehydrogenase, putative n=1 Tax=Babesia ovis TaxID=5869 RepID=A0A9W5T8G6_BABOV|nr:dehydrogenase, putative [Babesia ovis]
MDTYNTLLEVPSNLKESLDWIAAIKESNGTLSLATAVYELLLTNAPITESAKNAPTTEPAKNASTTEPAKNAPATETAKNAPITESAKNAAATEPAKNAPTTEPAKNASTTEPAKNASTTETAKNAPATETANDDATTKATKPESTKTYRSLVLPTGGVKSCLASLGLRCKDKTSVPYESFVGLFNKTIAGLHSFLVKVTHSKYYTSSYTPEATWANSCSKKPGSCASIFVSIVNPVFTNIDRIREQCNDGIGRAGRKVDTNGSAHIGDEFEASGFDLTNMCPKTTCVELENVATTFWNDFKIIKKLTKQYGGKNEAFKSPKFSNLANEFLIWGGAFGGGVNV